MGIENTGEVPFHTVYLHGMVRDEKGEKMSKVKGNVLNPLDAMKEYGTDALRFALSTGTSPGNDMKMADNRLESSRNFVNKIWNASRFVIRSLETEKTDLKIEFGKLPVEDRWILSRLNRTISSSIKLMEDFQFGEAQRQIYDFLWSEFCDWYIEIAKIRLRDKAAISPVPVLVHVLESSLRLLHPFMPFITEELWQTLKRRIHSGPAVLPPSKPQARERIPETGASSPVSASTAWPESIMIAAYPAGNEEAIDPLAEGIMASLIEIIHAIRNARAEHKVESNKWIEAHIYAGDLKTALQPYYQSIQTLAQAKPLELLDTRHQGASDENDLALVLKDSEVLIPLASMVDLDAEKARLTKELEEVLANVNRLQVRLNDVAFTGKAPAAVVQKERDRLAVGQDKIQRLQQQLERFK
jgi:valyl-tRNA synthetase